MKKTIKIIAAMMISVLVLTACGPKLPEDVVASVNGVNITKDYYDKTVATVAKDNFIEERFGEDVWDKVSDTGETYRVLFARQILDLIIVQEMVYQDSEAKGVRATDEEIQKEYDLYMETANRDPEYVEFLKSNNIDEEFLKHHLSRALTNAHYTEDLEKQAPVTESDAKKYYDENADKFKNDKVRASHILFSTKSDNKEPLSDEEKAEKLKLAEEVLAKARSGEDFAKLAEEYSDDPGSAPAGGDLGFFSQGVMVPEFNDKAFSMEVGEISDLVETTFGYHIIYLTDKDQSLIPFEDLKDDLINELRLNKYKEKVEELRKSAKIIINKALEIK